MKRSGVLSLIAVAVLTGVTVLATTRCRAVRVAPAERLEGWTDQPYAALLTACVRDGLVDYATLRSDFATDLDRFLDAVGRRGPKASPSDFPTEADRLAYHLNAYNALMLRRWLDAGAGKPEAERRTVNRLWFVFDQWLVDDRWVTLHRLEQQWILGHFGEPRVHFALVCGAMSCPPLLGEPFAGARLDAQLDGLARRWLREPDALIVDEKGIAVSRIFDWYADDFELIGGLSGVLERYLDVGDPRREAALTAAREGGVRFLEYDWTINDWEEGTDRP